MGTFRRTPGVRNQESPSDRDGRSRTRSPGVATTSCQVEDRWPVAPLGGPGLMR